jgi:hypothetical protein
VASERDALALRVARAISLEQAIIEGLEPIPVGAVELAREIEGHLRALLRDVICGHLALDLAELADELIGGGHDPAGEAAPNDRPAARTGFAPYAPVSTPGRGELFP